MTATTKRSARGQAGASVGTGQQTSPKPTGGRREVQGMRGDRNRCQAAPTWPELPGERAMRLLEAMWGKPRNPMMRRRR